MAFLGYHTTAKRCKNQSERPNAAGQTNGRIWLKVGEPIATTSRYVLSGGGGEDGGALFARVCAHCATCLHKFAHSARTAGPIWAGKTPFDSDRLWEDHDKVCSQFRKGREFKSREMPLEINPRL